MQSPNPIRSKTAPHYRQASGLAVQSRLGMQTHEDSFAKMWRKNAELEAALNSHAQSLRECQRQLDRLRRRFGVAEPVGESYFPFQLYASPAMTQAQATTLGLTTPADGAWRSYRVRAGAVETTAVLGTDGTNENPDDPDAAIDDTTLTALSATADPTLSLYYPATTGWPSIGKGVDILVPEGMTFESPYFVWIDRSTTALATAPVIAFGDSAPGNWWTFDYILIAMIDTDTYADQSKAVVRQYLRNDVPGPFLVCNADA